MKKRSLCISVFILGVILALEIICSNCIYADVGDASFIFELSINGKQRVKATPGDILTVSMLLCNSDEQSSYTMYAMQDEIRYDDEFFEIIDGGTILASGIENTDIALVDGDRAFYLNFLSTRGGEEWEPEVLIATFQVRVKATEGESTLRNENCIVSLQDGSDSYPVEVSDVTVVIAEEGDRDTDSGKDPDRSGEKGATGTPTPTMTPTPTPTQTPKTTSSAKKSSTTSGTSGTTRTTSGSSGKAAKTGDESPVAMFVFSTLAAALVAAELLRQRKKLKN